MKPLFILTILLMSAIWLARADWRGDFDDHYFATAGATATGGIVTNYTLSGTNFQAHIFLSNGTFTVSGGSLSNCNVLVVGGGAAGGCVKGYNQGVGGGGAGGIIYTNTVISGTNEVVVGLGAPARTAYGAGPNGSNSTFIGLTAFGGGYGGANGNGGDGGSGGGAGSGGGIRYGGVTIAPDQGNNGANGGGTYRTGGGGGGAGGAGELPVGADAGAGGAGVLYNISGVDAYYAAGGGGSGTNLPALGGSGIGGDGGAGTENGTAGAANTGSGGGASGMMTANSGAGADGIVIVRYVKP